LIFIVAKPPVSQTSRYDRHDAGCFLLLGS